MNNDIKADKENKMTDAETEVTSENKELFSDWSNIDATSIYRVGSESNKTVGKAELKQSIKETKSFLKIVIAMIIIITIIIIISSYY